MIFMVLLKSIIKNNKKKELKKKGLGPDMSNPGGVYFWFLLGPCILSPILRQIMCFSPLMMHGSPSMLEREIWSDDGSQGWDLGYMVCAKWWGTLDLHLNGQKIRKRLDLGSNQGPLLHSFLPLLSAMRWLVVIIITLDHNM